MDFLKIFYEILMPTFILIAGGFFLQKKFSLSILTMTRLQIYFMIPALLFVNIYNSALSGEMIGSIAAFTALLFFFMGLASLGAAKVFRFGRAKEKAFVNSVVLINQGNFGIPVIAMAFAGEQAALAMSIHMIALTTGNFLLNSFGLYNAGSSKLKGREALMNVFKLPMIYAIGLALLLKGLGAPVPKPLLQAMTVSGNGLVALALLTLGAQLAETKVRFAEGSLYLSNLLRLVAAPLLAWGMATAGGLDSLMARVLVIGAAGPTAVNSVLLAVEFDGDAAYASETVFTSTVLSAVTVTGTIFFALQYI